MNDTPQTRPSRRTVLAGLGAAAGGLALDSTIFLPKATASGLAAIRSGLDYSWRPHPSTTAMNAAGYTFVCRYLSHDPAKNLTRAEADQLIAAGIDIVSNWQVGGSEALQGYSRGVTDAQEAHAQAAACGAPPARPIYFSVDFDPTTNQQVSVNAYFDGIASVLGRNRTGAYGGYNTIKRLYDAGKIAWGWQTHAWSGGQWDSRAHLRQIQNNIVVDGAQCDRNQSMVDDFGQWGNRPALPSLQGPAVYNPANGNMEVYFNSTARLMENYWSAGAGWSGAQNLGASIYGRPSAIHDPATNSVMVFYNSNSVLAMKKWSPSGGWSTQSLGGSISNSPAVVRNPRNGNIEVYYSNTYGRLAENYLTPLGRWSGEQVLGDPITSSPTVVANPGNGNIEVYFKSADGGDLREKYWSPSGGWAPTVSLDASIDDAPTAVFNPGNGNTEVYFASRGTLREKYWSPSGGWSPLITLALNINSTRPAAIVNPGNGNSQVYFNSGSSVMEMYWSPAGGWSPATALANGVGSTPPFVVHNPGNGNIQVYFTGSGGQLLEKYWSPNGAWSDVHPIGGVATT